MHKNISRQANLLEDNLKKDHGCSLANQAKSTDNIDAEQWI